MNSTPQLDQLETEPKEPSSEENSTNKRIFISYSRKDKKAIMAFVDLFRANDLEVWIDECGINASTEWAEQIAKAITDCDIFILFLSNTSVKSENVRKEIGVAASLGKKILPLKIEEVDIPASMLYHLNSLHFLETQKSSQEEIVKHTLRALGDTEVSNKIVKPKKSPLKSKLPLAVLGGGVLVVAMGVAAYSFLNKGAGDSKSQAEAPLSPASSSSAQASLEQQAEETSNLPGSDFVDKGTRVAVLYFENNTKNKPDLQPLEKGLAYMISSEATNYEGYDIVEREELSKVLNELKLSNTKSFNAQSTAKIGKLLGAKRLVFGSFMELFGTFRIDAKMVEVETGRIIQAASANGSAKDFNRLSSEIATKLFSEDQKPRDKKEGESKLPVEVALEIGKALQKMDDGDREAGIQMLNELAEQYPKSAVIKDAVKQASPAKKNDEEK